MTDVSERPAFIKNGWYGAGFPVEVGASDLLERRLLEESVLFFRKADGNLSAIGGMCPHRFAPLAMGRVLEGDIVECPYHGLQFNEDGACVHNPRGEGKIAPNLKVKSYPVVERYGVIWIWMGDASQADIEKIPDLSHIVDLPRLGQFSGYMHSNCGYELVIDNLLDASHADYVHPGLLSPGGAFSRRTPEVVSDDDSIAAVFAFDDEPVPQAIDPNLPRPGDRTAQEYSFKWVEPGTVLIAGEYRQAEMDEAACAVNAHLVTPETATSTHYWFLGGSNFGEQTEESREFAEAAFAAAFLTEDKPMLEAVERMMAGRNFWGLRPALLEGDRASVMVRRRIEKAIARETAVDA